MTELRLWHVACADPAARRAFLRRHRALAPGAWWFVDLPAPHGPWLELATAADPDDWRPDVRLAVPVAAPVTLTPGTFPGGHVPSVMYDGLALGSARVAALLDAQGDLAPLLAAELRRALTAAFPDPAARRDAALWHALWLARATGHESLLAEARLAELLESDDPDPSPIDPDPPWSQLARTDGQSDDPGWIVAIARMLHIHTVRLLGPDHPEPIRRELAGLLALAAAPDDHPLRSD